MVSTRGTARVKATESPDDQEMFEESIFKKVLSGNETYYKCTRCLRRSRRRFNIVRHYKRFHFLTKVRKCCGAIFHTKAEYYKHSLNKHFNTKCYSRMFAEDYGLDTKTRSKRRCLRENTIKKKEIERESTSTSEDYESLISKVKALAFEDIPLINFLRYPNIIKDVLRSNKRVEGASSNIDTKTQDKILETAEMRTGNFAEETKENRANAASSRVRSPSSLHELPLKKRILQQGLMCAKTSVANTNRRPLIGLNDNESKKTMARRSIMSDRNKENNPNEKSNVNIIIDRSVSSQILTRQQHIFLSSIDFSDISNILYRT